MLQNFSQVSAFVFSFNFRPTSLEKPADIIKIKHKFEPIIGKGLQWRKLLFAQLRIWVRYGNGLQLIKRSLGIAVCFWQQSNRHGIWSERGVLVAVQMPDKKLPDVQVRLHLPELHVSISPAEQWVFETVRRRLLLDWVGLAGGLHSRLSQRVLRSQVGLQLPEVSVAMCRVRGYRQVFKMLS